jgi:pimeloyl-ACP methyl ester carboxylesterase
MNRIWRIPICVLLVLALFGCERCTKTESQINGSGTIPEVFSLPQWWPSKPSSPNRIATVYVHGLFGDTMTTWRADTPGAKYLFEYVQDYPEFKSTIDTFVFGFPSHFLKSGSLTPTEAAKQLNLYLENNGINKYDQVVFVAHSMGGIVVMNLLVANKEWRKRTSALVLYAVPKNGAQIAQIAEKVASNPALKALGPIDSGNPGLELLDYGWREIPEQERFPVLCAYEKKPYREVGPVIVPQTSATSLCTDQTIGISADHSGIVKPTNDNLVPVEFLVNALRKYALPEPKLKLVGSTELPNRYELPFDVPDYLELVRMENPSGKELQLSYNDIDFNEINLIGSDKTSPPPAKIAQKNTELFFVMFLSAGKPEYTFSLQIDERPKKIVALKIGDTRRHEQRLAIWRKGNEEFMRSVLLQVATQAKSEEENQDAVVNGLQARLKNILQKESRSKLDAAGFGAVKTPPFESEAAILSAHWFMQQGWHSLADKSLQKIDISSAPQLAKSRAFWVGQNETLKKGDFGKSDVLGPNARLGFDPSGLKDPNAMSEALIRVKGLEGLGLTLKGDILAQENKFQAALDSYQKAGSYTSS